MVLKDIDPELLERVRDRIARDKSVRAAAGAAQATGAAKAASEEAE